MTRKAATILYVLFLGEFEAKRQETRERSKNAKRETRKREAERERERESSLGTRLFTENYPVLGIVPKVENARQNLIFSIYLNKPPTVEHVPSRRK